MSTGRAWINPDSRGVLIVSVAITMALGGGSVGSNPAQRGKVSVC